MTPVANLPAVPLVLLIKSGNFGTDEIDTGGKLSPVSMTPVANNGNNISLLTPLRELEEKIYLYDNSTTRRCPTKYLKLF
jgi:hypothetical protein